jgi:peptidoglycan hydrolase CwlO-like protein
MPTIPQSTPRPSPLDSLITLKSQYERSLSETETQASYLREQLSHVNALLLNQLVPPQAPIKSAEPALTLEEADAQVERLALAPAATEALVSNTPKPKASPSKSKAAPEPTPASGLAD